MSATTAMARKLKSAVVEAMMSSRLILRKLRSVTGTGRPQPIMEPPSAMLRAGIKTEPQGSSWTRGLRVMRPSILAVGSPRRKLA